MIVTADCVQPKTNKMALCLPQEASAEDGIDVQESSSMEC